MVNDVFPLGRPHKQLIAFDRPLARNRDYHFMPLG
jgi:hypothetical protein